jgi:predicted GIY-YIG superfamily endonuclease
MPTGKLYILSRSSSPEREPYVGIALDGNPRRRLREHNSGTCGCTNQRRCQLGRPWTLAAVAGVFPHPSPLRKFEHVAV